MTEKEIFKLSSLVGRELHEFEEETVKKDSQYLYDNACEIYATKFIGDCLIDYEFLEKLDYNLFPKENILRFITNYYLFNHEEMRESDLEDMFAFESDGIRKALKQRDNQMWGFYDWKTIRRTLQKNW